MVATTVTMIGILFLLLWPIGAGLAIWRSPKGRGVEAEGSLDPGAWAKLVDALRKAPTWISCAVIGILLLVFVVPVL